jgi:hypothetical protein
MEYIFFLATLIITMIKSRFTTVGMDNSDQFEPLKMSFMLDSIIKGIDIQNQFKGDKEMARAYYVGLEKVVMVEGINLKIILSNESFDKIWDLQKGQKPVEEADAAEWLKNNVVGNISKADLDDERARETN